VNAPAGLASRRTGDDVVDAAEILIIRGKEQGRLTPNDVMQGLPVIEAEPDQLERIFQVFREMGIEVSDSDGEAEEGDDTEDEVVNAEAVDTFSLDDPVRMYLKEIGRIACSAKNRRSSTRSSSSWATTRRATSSPRPTSAWSCPSPRSTSATACPSSTSSRRATPA